MAKPPSLVLRGCTTQLCLPVSDNFKIALSNLVAKIAFVFRTSPVFECPDYGHPLYVTIYEREEFVPLFESCLRQL